MQTIQVKGYGLMYRFQVHQQIARLNAQLEKTPFWENGWWLRENFIDSLKN